MTAPRRENALRPRSPRRRRLLADGLEPRVVLSVDVTTFPLASATARPKSPTIGPDGAIWFVDQNSIGRIDLGGDSTEFALPRDGMNPGEIVAGRDGALWFTEAARKIGRITTSGQVTEFPLPDGSGLPDHLTLGPDGDVWFAEAGASPQIGRIAPDGTVAEFPEGGSGAYVTAMTAGPDGDVWAAESGVPAILKIAPDGSLTRFPISARISGPNSITQAPDGRLWFADPAQGTVGRVDPSTGKIDEFGVNPTPLQLAGGPDLAVYGIAPGGFVARIATTGSVASVQPLLPETGGTGIVLAPDGALWVPLADGGAFDRIGPDALGASGVISISAASSLTATAESAASFAPLATLRTAESGPQLSDYSATIDWGDGSSPSAGTLAAVSAAPGSHSPPGLVVQGSHTFEKAGSYTITITATGKDGSSASTTGTIAVSGEPLSLTSAPISAQATVASSPLLLAVGTGVDPSAVGHLSASIDWGDGSPATPATLIPVFPPSRGNAPPPGSPTFNILGVHTYPKVGSYSATVTIASVSGASASTSDPVTVSSAPSFKLYGLAGVATVGQAFPSQPVAVLASDPPLAPGDVSATIDWGDGSPVEAAGVALLDVPASPPGSANPTPAHTVLTLSGGHTYATAGTFTVHVSIATKAGDATTTDTTVTVQAAAPPAPPIPPIPTPLPVIPAPPAASPGPVATAPAPSSPTASGGTAPASGSTSSPTAVAPTGGTHHPKKAARAKHRKKVAAQAHPARKAEVHHPAKPAVAHPKGPRHR